MAETPDAPLSPAGTVMSLLFRKLHPLLEDTAHALDRKAPRKELEKLHEKLMNARIKTLEVLSAELEKLDADTDAEGDLFIALEDLVDTLQPSGEGFQESLTLTQLCLEDAPETFLPLVPEAEREVAPWAKRLQAFREKVQDPAQRAEARWQAVDPEIGEDEGWDEE